MIGPLINFFKISILSKLSSSTGFLFSIYSILMNPILKKIIENLKKDWKNKIILKLTLKKKKIFKNRLFLY